MANTYKWVISGLHTQLNNEELGLDAKLEAIANPTHETLNLVS